MAEKMNTYDCGELAPIFAKGLVSRGFNVEGASCVEGELKCKKFFDGGKVVSDAPKAVFDDMVKAYTNRNKKK